MDSFLVYMTMKDREEAGRIGAVLVEKRLAACVNILGGCDSLFWWDGAVQKESEIVMIAKTTRDCLEILTETVIKLHSYDVPCVVAVKLAGGNPAFMSWIHEVTESNEP